MTYYCNKTVNSLELDESSINYYTHEKGSRAVGSNSKHFVFVSLFYSNLTQW